MLSVYLSSSLLSLGCCDGGESIAGVQSIPLDELSPVPVPKKTSGTEFIIGFRSKLAEIDA
jgi:hypothetical protein